MSIPAAIRAMMKESVTVKTKVTDDDYGTDQLSSGTAVKARVQYGHVRTFNSTGEQVWSSVQVFLADDVSALTPEGEVTLPTGATPPIINVKRHQWPDGTYSVEVFM